MDDSFSKSLRYLHYTKEFGVKKVEFYLLVVFLGIGLNIVSDIFCPVTELKSAFLILSVI